ncbi:MAG TPA: ABC transporter substrate-binding protein [Firmicutes bacterium]|nr:ABC transporter substrate-binding protein [Bacillota bacterium]
MGKKGLISLITAVLVAVCAGAALAAAPREGGTLQIAVKSVTTLDPHLTASDFDYAVLSQIFDTLVATGKDGQPIPRLATRWENPDDLTWIFYLREDAYWHDGNAVFPKGQSRPVTAEDVKYSLERVLNPETKSPFLGALSNIDRVEVVDDFTVKIVTKAPDPFLLDPIRLAGIAIVPKEAVETLGPAGFARQAIGSGPFKLVRFVPDDQVVLDKNESYWKKPLLDRVVFKIIPDDIVAVMALEAGDVHVSLSVPPNEVDRLRGDQRIKLYRSAQGWYRGLGFNVQTPPFDELKVRRALAMAVDIDSAVANVFGDNAQRAYGQVGPGLIGYDPSLKELWPYDPEGALALLAEAGFTPGPDGMLQRDGEKLTVEIKTMNEPARVRIVTILVTQLRELGINASLAIQEVGTWSADLQNGNTGLFMDFAYSGATGLHAMFHSDNIGASNAHFYSNPVVDELLSRGSVTIDPKEREVIWKEAQRLVMEDVVVIPLYFEFGYTAADARVNDFVPPQWNFNIVSEENNVWLSR